MPKNPRDVSSDLLMMVSGHAATSSRNFSELLENWIFGNGEGRDVKVLWLHEGEESDNTSMIREWFAATQFDDIREFTYSSDEEYLLAHTRATDELFFDTEAYEKAYVSLYDPDRDLEAVTHAKDLPGDEFYTFNIEGLIDYFEGYETPEEKKAREELEALQEAQKPRRAPRKKAVTPKVPETVPEPPTGLTEPSRAILGPTTQYQVGDTVTVAGIELTKHSSLTPCLHYFYRADDQNEYDPLICKNCGQLDNMAPTVEDIELQWAELTQEQVSSLKKDRNRVFSTEEVAVQQMAKDIVAMGEALTSMIENFKNMLGDLG